MKKGLGIALAMLLVFSVLGLGIAGCAKEAPKPAPAPATTQAPAATPTPAPAAIKITCQTGYGQTHAISKSLTWWAEQLQKKTNGKVNVEIFYGTPLGAANSQLEMVMAGTVDVAYFSFSWKTGVYPFNEVFYLPLPIKKAETVARVHYGLYQKGYLDKELADVKLAYFADGTPGVISTNRPIRKMEDFKAMKIRGVGIQADMITRLGGTPINIASAETYQAMEKGVADGVYLNLASQSSMKLYEIVKYVTAFESSACFSSAFVMNRDTYKKLPADVQAAIDGLIEEASVYEARLYDEDTITGTAAFQKAGVEFITLSAEENKRWTDALSPILDKWVSDNAAKGLPAKQFLDDAIALAKKY